jgi:predicted PurR-regulated permease PerM
MSTARPQERNLRTAALALLILGCVIVLRPFLTASLMALIVVLSTWPIYRRLREAVGMRHTLAASIMTAILAFLLLFPTILLASEAAGTVAGLIKDVRAEIEGGTLAPPTFLTEIPGAADWVALKWEELTTDREALASAAAAVFDPAQAVVVEAGKVIGRGIIETATAIFIAFFLYRDADPLLAAVRAGGRRLVGEFSDELLGVVHDTLQGVVLGIAGTAAAQGGVAFVGLWVLGVPLALVGSLATAVLSLIPAGPPVVWVGASVWLLTADRPAAALIMFLYGLLVISTIDNIVKPMLISQGNGLPFALVLAGVLGGLLAFGFVGVFVGPALLAVAVAVFRHWTGSRTNTAA